MGPVRKVAVTAAIVAMAAVGCGGTSAPAYDEAFQADFERACGVAVPGETGPAVCRCWYERVSTEVPIDELPPLEQLTATEAPEDIVDPEVYEWLADCARAFGDSSGVPVTAPPPVTSPRPTTTTTVLIAEE